MAQSAEKKRELARLCAAEWRKNNREAHRAAAIKYYENNKEARRQRSKEYSRKLKIAALKLHGSTSCMVCGESRPYCLAFHHRDPSTKAKYRDIIRLPYDKLVIELGKCDVLCHNCHTEVHYLKR